MKILVTGAQGQLGSELKSLLDPGRTVFLSRQELDIADSKSLGSFFSNHKPDVLINAAAYTAVDKAEDESKEAFRFNGEAVGTMANFCAKNGTFLVHISTDYVFDGTKSSPYREEDPVSPVGAYGKSKLEGERRFLESSCAGILLRTSWVYSRHGKNFVKTILRLAQEKPEIGVVDDQIGTPTHARDLARFIAHILPNRNEIKKEIYHFSNEGVCSWYDFARAIVEESGLSCRVKAIQTQDYPTKAIRPAYSVLSKRKLKARFGFEIPHWRDSLRDCLKEGHGHFDRR